VCGYGMGGGGRDGLGWTDSQDKDLTGGYPTMKEEIASDDTMGLVFFSGADAPRDVYRWTLTTTQEQGSGDIRRLLVIEGRDEKGNPIALVSAILHQRGEPIRP
jgi:hypothetical protein